MENFKIGDVLISDKCPDVHYNVTRVHKDRVTANVRTQPNNLLIGKVTAPKDCFKKEAHHAK